MIELRSRKSTKPHIISPARAALIQKWWKPLEQRINLNLARKSLIKDLRLKGTNYASLGAEPRADIGFAIIAKLNNQSPPSERSKQRELYWEPIKQALQAYLKKNGKGAARYLAKRLGVAGSQIHRFSCPICEHDAMPAISTALELVIALDEPFQKQSHTPRHRKGCTKEMRERARQRALLPSHLLSPAERKLNQRRQYDPRLKRNRTNA